MEKLLTRNFNEAFTLACAERPELEKKFSKVRALLEDYAISKGTSISKLLIIDICNAGGQLQRDLLRHVLEVYPLSDTSRPSYATNMKRIGEAVVAMSDSTHDDGDLPCREWIIPDLLQPVLPFIPRNRLRKPDTSGFIRINYEARLQSPFSPHGEYVLLACLKVCEDYNIDSLDSLFLEHYQILCRTFRVISRGKSVGSLTRVKKLLNIKSVPPKRAFPISDMLEPFKTELETYRKRALIFGKENDLDEFRQAERLREKGARYGVTLNEHSESTVEGALMVLSSFYAAVLPIINARGMKEFGIRDVLRIVREVTVDDGEEVPKDLNPFADFFREIQLSQSSRYKRAGRDSGQFQCLVSAIKYVAAFNGYFSLRESFGKAYQKVNFDSELIEARKATKKKIFSIEYLDDQISHLRVEFTRIIRTKSYAEGGKSAVRRDINFCLFYVVLVTLRYLGYRQQCIRDCVFGVNIVFGRGGLITLYWAKGQVKNKKPLKVVLTADRQKGEWEPLVHALTTYRECIYRYALEQGLEHGGPDKTQGQFFLKQDVRGRLISFSHVNSMYMWFIKWARRILIFPEEAIIAGINLNPHHLRGICMDWMHDIGMTEDEIATVTGDTVGVIKQRYRNRHAVQDGTPILARTDRRLREEREIDMNGPLGQLEEKHKAEMILRDRRENALQKQVNDLIAQQGIMTNELTSLRTENALLRANQQEQMALTKELVEGLNRSARVPRKGNSRNSKKSKR